MLASVPPDDPSAAPSLLELHEHVTTEHNTERRTHAHTPPAELSMGVPLCHATAVSAEQKQLERSRGYGVERQKKHTTLTAKTPDIGAHVLGLARGRLRSCEGVRNLQILE